MILGFLGKGGSGKTTMATLFLNFLLEKNKKVLAIDNDHNMDFKYNLGHITEMPYIGRALEEIFQEISIQSSNDISKFETEYFFSLNPKDKITQKYSINLKENLDLMSAGPSTDDILYGNQCSHVLTAPLKVYLPLLKVEQDEFVIVDEKAGIDGVGTGITTGFNLAVVVAEATLHGIKTAKQIIDLLKFYQTPFIIFINKIKENQNLEELKKDFLKDDLVGGMINEEKIFTFKLDLENIDLKISKDNQKEFEKVLKYLEKLSDDRKERTKQKIEKAKEYKEVKNKK